MDKLKSSDKRLHFLRKLINRYRQLMFETEEEVITEEIACFHRTDDMSPASLGLSLKEAKLITSEAQKSMIGHQIKRYIAAEKMEPLK